MGLNLSSKNHIPEDKPTNVIPDPIGNLLHVSKWTLCEDVRVWVADGVAARGS